MSIQVVKVSNGKDRGTTITKQRGSRACAAIHLTGVLTLTFDA